jgi:hypothetical protein
MEDKATPIENLFERAEAYGKTSLNLLKLKAIDKTSELISTVISWLIVVVVVALFFIIFSIGIALWLGDILGKSYYGFFLVSGFYALLGIIFFFWVRKPIHNSIISKMIK